MQVESEPKVLDGTSQENPAWNLPQRDAGDATALVVVGMAGAGKTTFVTALYTYLIHVLKKKVYAINLDPAVDTVPFPANIDIRDTVNYKNVMKQYSLGPNGAILTALNLYATRFDQVLKLIEKRRGTLDYVLIDTPGQIEVFNWSASGTIILDSLALSMPTQICFLIDSVRCQRPTTLMATMMYACSVLYKSKLPFIGVFTKSDLVDPEKQMRWISDPQEFADAANDEDTYASTLSKSCALALSHFYEAFPRIPIAIIGEAAKIKGFDLLLQEVEKLKDEYFDMYLGWIQQERTRMLERKKADAEKEYSRFEDELGRDDD